ncbi:MAG TPA: NAD(P)H-binding protein [Terracidiphilus sp.]|nr:NAD(P)H-binding protein [Terracidiphilus sp.]
MKSAIVFGSTGFVGSHLLGELLKSPDYGSVTAVIRKPSSITHPKLRMLIGDYSSFADMMSGIAAEEVFITLGTTKANSPDEAEYYQVDHDYPVLAARVAKEGGAKSVFLLTAIGANPNSRLFYVRTKGETERDIIAHNFDHTHIFRPSMITGNRKEKRSLLEGALMRAWPALNPLLRWKADKYRGMSGPDIARAMIKSAKNQTEKLQIYQWREMHELLQR